MTAARTGRPKPACMRIGALVCVLAGTLGSPAATAWKPERFGAYCGAPKYFNKGVGETTKPPYYRDATSANDKDFVADGQCASDSRMGQVSEYAADILGKLAALKHGGRGFASPVPSRLGPIIGEVDAAGNRVGEHVRLYMVPKGMNPPGYAQALTPCDKTPTPAVKDRLSITTLNAERMDRLPTPTIYYMLAHELMHVVQNAQAFRNNPSTDNCRGMASWVTEGTASAVGWALAAKRFGEPPLSLRAAYHYYGLRYYNLPLNRTFNSVRNPGYRSSSLWRFIVERYGQGNYGLLREFFDRPDTLAGEDDWIRWLDQSLRGIQAISKPMHLVYPEFLTEFAAWGGARFRRVKESRWLSEGFGGCRKVTLEPGSAPRADVSLPLFVNSGQCLLIDVGLNPAAHAWATLKFNVRSTNKRLLDSLHLGAAYTGGAQPQNCYRAAKGGNASVSCLLKPTLARLPAAASADGAVRHTRSWRGTRLVADGKTIKNLFVISYVPPKPSDKDIDDASKRKQKITLEIGLDVAAVKTASQKTGNTGKSGKTGNTAAVGDVGGVADDQAGYPLGGEQSLDPGNMDFGKILFAENIGANLQKMMQQKTGDRRSFSFASGRLDSGEGEPTLLPNLNLLVALVSEQGLRFGQTGEFPATVSGGLGLDAGDTIIPAPGFEPPATVTVHEFSEQQLHLSVTGDYCRLADLDMANKRCRDPQSFFAELKKPFGWMYDPQVTLTSIDSPGMALYRAHTLKRLKSSGLPDMGELLKNLPQPPDPQPPGPPDTQAPAAGGTTPQCRCDCAEYAEFRQSQADYLSKVEAMMAGDSAVSQAAADAMNAKSQCMDQCGMRYYEAGCMD